MSTEIKPGQVWAWKGGCGSRSGPGVTFEIVEASVDAPDVTYRYRPREGFDSVRIFAAPARDILNSAALLVETVDASEMTHDEIAAISDKETADFLAPDATPAPLDPSKVKAGDTVTLEADGGRKVTAPVSAQELPYTTKGTWFLDVYYDEDKPQSFSGIHWTLTDHQPAPEPEPEWEDGQIGDALVHGASVRGFISNGGESFVFSVPGGGYHEAGHGSFEDFVPLVVIDPAAVDVVAIAKAMHQVDYPGLDFALNLDQSAYVAKARAALAHLGIEATS